MQKNRSTKNLKKELQEKERKKQKELFDKMRAAEKRASYEKNRADQEARKRKALEKELEKLKALENVLQDKRPTAEARLLPAKKKSFYKIDRTAKHKMLSRDPFVEDMQKACKMPTLSGLKKVSSQRKWQLVPKAKASLLIRESTAVRKKSSKVQPKKKKPRVLFPTKKQEKKAPVPTSISIRRNPRKDLRSEFQLENDNSDSSILESVRRASTSRKQENPFRKKSADSQEKDNREQGKKKKRKIELIVIDDSSDESDSNDSSDDESMVR